MSPQPHEQPTAPHELPDSARHPAWSSENEDEARFVARLTLDLCIAQMRANNGASRPNVPGAVTQVIGTLQEARRQTAQVRAGATVIKDTAASATAPGIMPDVPHAQQGVVAEARVTRWPTGWAIVCHNPKVLRGYEFQHEGETAEFAVMLRDEGGWTLVYDPEATPVKALVDEIDREA